MANVKVKYELSTKIERNGKTNWHRMGVVLEGDKGEYAIIDSIPVGFTGLVSFFEPKAKDDVSRNSNSGSYAAPKSVDDLTDDIPF